MPEIYDYGKDLSDFVCEIGLAAPLPDDKMCAVVNQTLMDLEETASSPAGTNPSSPATIAPSKVSRRFSPDKNTLSKVLKSVKNSKKKKQCRQKADSQRYQIPNPPRKFKCDNCPWSFHRIEEFNRHQDSCLDKKEHKCTYCDKCFSRKDNLKNHIKKHTGEKNYCCDVIHEVTGQPCGKRFIRSDELANHQWNKHKIPKAKQKKRKVSKTSACELHGKGHDNCPPTINHTSVIQNHHVQHFYQTDPQPVIQHVHNQQIYVQHVYNQPMPPQLTPQTNVINPNRNTHDELVEILTNDNHVDIENHFNEQRRNLVPD